MNMRVSRHPLALDGNERVYTNLTIIQENHTYLVSLLWSVIIRDGMSTVLESMDSPLFDHFQVCKVC